jgi:RHS repeat-associated protein
MFDSSTGLNYLNARYLDSKHGRFVSQDSTYLSIGDELKLKADSGQIQKIYLSDPQQLNSYSYAGDNPIVKKDPNGRSALTMQYSGPMFGNLSVPASTPYILGGLIVATAIPSAVRWVLSDPQSGYETTPMLASSGKSTPRWAGPRQIPDPELIGWPGEPPMGIEDFLYNLNKNPKDMPPWMKGVIVGGTGAIIFKEQLYDAYKNLRQGGGKSNVESKSQSTNSSKQTITNNKSNSGGLTKHKNGYYYFPLK